MTPQALADHRIPLPFSPVLPSSRPPVLPSSRQIIRRLLLALVLFGALGLVAELLLLEHFHSAWKLAPLLVLVPAIGTGALVWIRPLPRALTLFRQVMLACVAVGAAGLVLHYKGNLEFALERDPSLSGWTLLWKGFRGATPALAPGALAQLGLLGLVFGYRHPALAGPADHDQEVS